MTRCPRCAYPADGWVGVSDRRYCVRCGSDLEQPGLPGIDWGELPEPRTEPEDGAGDDDLDRLDRSLWPDPARESPPNAPQSLWTPDPHPDSPPDSDAS